MTPGSVQNQRQQKVCQNTIASGRKIVSGGIDAQGRAGRGNREHHDAKKYIASGLRLISTAGHDAGILDSREEIADRMDRMG